MKHAVGDDWGRLRSRVQCVRVFTFAMYVCARVPVSITSHLSPSVHPFVCLSVDRSVGSPPPSTLVSAKKREWEGEMCGWTRVRSLSDPMVGHATEVADPIYRDGRNFMSYNGQRTHTRHSPNGTVNLLRTKNLGHLGNECENRATIFRIF